jgi:hypothetical protein
MQGLLENGISLAISKYLMQPGHLISGTIYRKLSPGK